MALSGCLSSLFDRFWNTDLLLAGWFGAAGGGQKRLSSGVHRHRERTTRHTGYQISQRVRKRVEEISGWMKTIGLMRKLRH
jgi:hypothetical protein